MKSQELKEYKLPDAPGVYLFKNKGNVLYVGKATSLKDRVKSYFSNDLIQTRGPLLVDMIYQANKIDFIKTNSVLEAIILEANLIKKYQPKYNTKEKDNKSFNYILITNEDFPRILILRGREIEKGLPYEINYKFGPFTSGESLRIILKIIRKIFPFRDRCEPCVNRQAAAGLITHQNCKPCFNRQLGLCPGVCDGSIDKKDYGKVIKKIVLILSGKINKLKNSLNKEMKSFASAGEYEQAKVIRDQIFALEHIQDVALIASEATTFSPPQLRRGDYLASLSRRSGSDNRGGCLRIEAYDAAHLSGTNNVGVMVVMEDGELKKSDYRKFKINYTKGDDIGALKEMLERRLKHTEWPMPDLIVLDGGMAQMNVAKKSTAPNPSLSKEGKRAVIVCVTKDNHHKAKAIIGREDLVKKYKKEILLINSEAHRFAIAFHRQVRSKL